MAHDERKCKYEPCEQRFIPWRESNVFCSNSCRNAWHAEQDRKMRREWWAKQQQSTREGKQQHGEAA